MTFKDKLEIGLKEDAPFRRDNLPSFQKAPDGPETRPDDETRSPEEPGAREAIAAAHVDVLPAEADVDTKADTRNGADEETKRPAPKKNGISGG
ncbi:MAG: hypothetical protein KAY59_04105 [Acidobacteria bacterium]|jgi:hypothetical protein|nr:hypothetical protein [Acidobacteriota bacterium]MBP8273585.1 hypothetical protein [Acidobacteriota bacterium]